MTWPVAIVVVIGILGVVAVASTVLGGKAAVEAEEAKGKYGEQYRMLSADYEKLAKEMRDLLAAMQADTAEVRAKVDSMEKMMREVG